MWKGARGVEGVWKVLPLYGRGAPVWKGARGPRARRAWLSRIEAGERGSVASRRALGVNEAEKQWRFVVAVVISANRW